MKKIQIFSVIALVLSLSSCQIVGDIFKTGVGVGIFLVVAVLGLVVFLISKATGK